MAQLLEATAVRPRMGLAGHEPNHEALLRGDIDLYADYLGTACGATSDSNRSAARRRRTTWCATRLASAGAWSGYHRSASTTPTPCSCPCSVARELGVRRVSDLVPHAARLRLGATEEVLRPDSQVRFAPGGYEGLRRAYGLAFSEAVPLPAEYGATFDALGARKVDVIIDFPVNPRMVSLNLLELRDDRHFFAPYFAAPVARGAFLLAHPGARERIERLAGRISNRRAARMNHAVELEARAPDLAAAKLLHDLKLM